MEYLTGTIKWFNNAKGLGFIEPTDVSNNEDIFVHFSVIIMDGFKSLKTGESVRFLMEKGEKGYMATEVIPESIWPIRSKPKAIIVRETRPETEDADVS
ncbi:MAG: cold shock domain-containing protein [Endozoicomonadaceae bacterium]|nr:cold shock domain-containing protein [Endozoicomonadaceae bacterium]